MTEDAAAEVLTGKGLTKSYGGTVVLDSVDITMHAGERHAVTGENGAGKSTLIKLLGGIVKQDSGEVLDGSGRTISSAIDARESGIAIVHQHLSLVPTMSVAENCVLPDFPTRRGITNRRQVRETAERVMARVDLDLDPKTMVGDLSFAERQMLEIGRGLLTEPRVLILDEPTSALTPGETNRLFELLLGINADHDTAILYVSHRIGELYTITERATVLRDGKLVDRLELADNPSSALVAAMVGRQIELLARRDPTPQSELGPPVLTVKGLSGHGVEHVDLEVRSGEICAIAGLVGAGRTELARQIFGVDRRDEGLVKISEAELPSGKVKAALACGVGFVPEDRHGDGIALDLSNADNALAPNLDYVYPGGFLRPGRRSEIATSVLVDGDVRPPDPLRTTGSLSGGNQQKIVIGKWLVRDLQLLILDEPTAGVDVEAKNQIHKRVSDLAESGLAVLLISSDLPEVLTLADRIVVMREGQIAGEVLPGDEWTEEHVITLATGQHDDLVIEVV
ncbi:MAG: sugar ABC transporter ATP-binding protein [Actinomycetota bacterium]